MVCPTTVAAGSMALDPAAVATPDPYTALPNDAAPVPPAVRAFSTAAAEAVAASMTAWSGPRGATDPETGIQGGRVHTPILKFSSAMARLMAGSGWNSHRDASGTNSALEGVESICAPKGDDADDEAGFGVEM